MQARLAQLVTYRSDCQKKFTPMAAITLHIAPDDNFDDWVVHDGDGRELGHYPTREAAELATQAVVRKRGGELVVHFADGRVIRHAL